MGEGAGKENIRNQIRDLSMLTGWTIKKSFSGNVPLIKSLTADAKTRAITKIVQGSISPSGSLTKAFICSLSGSISFVGAFPGQTYSFLEGLTWTQLQSYIYRDFYYKRISPKVKALLLGTITSIVGSFSTDWWLIKTKLCSGLLSSSGAISQLIKDNFSGGLSSSAGLSQLIKDKLSGSISPSGLLSYFTGACILALKTYTQLESWTYSTIQNCTYGYIHKVLLGGIMSSSAMVTRKAIALKTAVLTSSGSLVSIIKTGLAGSLGPVGLVEKLVKSSLAGGLTSSSTLKKLLKVLYTGSLSSSGNLMKSGYESLTDLFKKLIELLQLED